MKNLNDGKDFLDGIGIPEEKDSVKDLGDLLDVDEEYWNDGYVKNSETNLFDTEKDNWDDYIILGD